MRTSLIARLKNRLWNRYSLLAIVLICLYIKFNVEIDHAVREYIKSDGFRVILGSSATGVVGWLFYKKGK